MRWPDGASIPWPAPNTFYALGRDTVHALWEHLGPTRPIRRVLVPDYFCHEVTRAWTSRGMTVVRYFDNPTLPHPRWEDLEGAGSGDLVLAVNYFGIRTGETWSGWRAENPDVTLVEDHTHDPVSPWAMRSNADYAFASIRKVLPVPEGALMWSPRSHELPKSPIRASFDGSAMKLAAMICKREYLEGCAEPEETKKTFRGFQEEGEHRLADEQLAGPAPWTGWLLLRGYPSSWRERRTSNIRALIDLIADRTPAQPLFHRWAEGSCPLAVVLLFPSPELRDRARQRLIDADIYPTILWQMNSEASDTSRTLSGRLLCLPADQRYGESHIQRVAETLSEIDWAAGS